MMRDYYEELPKKKYSIIYADPPWSYRDKKPSHSRRGGTLEHYDTMSIGDIRKIPVQSLSNGNCMLFLWCTFPNLKEGLSVIEAWGFDYRTLGFSWIKLNKNNGKPFFGMGYYTKSNCEICLIGVKGKAIVESKKISSVIIHKMLDESDRVHSRKPDTVRDKIVELCGDIPRIELFARQKSDGWDSWGNEIE
jgi:site-specific DNA-methyltransferase (adenine-specific)